MQLFIGQGPNVTGLAFPNNRRLRPTRAVHMPIDTVFTDINLAPEEPLRKWRFPFEDFSPFLLPSQFGSLRGPKAFWIGNRLIIDFPITLHVWDPRLLREFRGRREKAFFVEVRFDLRAISHVSIGLSCRPVYSKPPDLSSPATLRRALASPPIASEPDFALPKPGFT